MSRRKGQLTQSSPTADRDLVGDGAIAARRVRRGGRKLPEAEDDDEEEMEIKRKSRR